MNKNPLPEFGKAFYIFGWLINFLDFIGLAGDSYVHLHLLTADKTKMGHLDELKFNPKMLKLYVPVEE